MSNNFLIKLTNEIRTILIGTKQGTFPWHKNLNSYNNLLLISTTANLRFNEEKKYYTIYSDKINKYNTNHINPHYQVWQFVDNQSSTTTTSQNCIHRQIFHRKAIIIQKKFNESSQQSFLNIKTTNLSLMWFEFTLIISLFHMRIENYSNRP